MCAQVLGNARQNCANIGASAVEAVGVPTGTGQPGMAPALNASLPNDAAGRCAALPAAPPAIPPLDLTEDDPDLAMFGEQELYTIHPVHCILHARFCL